MAKTIHIFGQCRPCDRFRFRNVFEVLNESDTREATRFRGLHCDAPNNFSFHAKEEEMVLSKKRIGIPARCTACGIVFETRNLIRGTVQNLTLTGNVTNCPKCGGRSQILDGVYNMVDSEVELVSGPPLTRALFEELQAIIEQSRARGDTPEQTLRQVNEKAPWVLRLLTRENMRDASAVLSMVATVVGAVVALRGTPSDSDIRRCAFEEVRAEQTIKNTTPKLPKKLSRANPEEHGGDGAKRIPNDQYEPTKYKRRPKNRAKRKR